MFPLSIFSRQNATVTLDGREVPPAAMTTKGAAVAVDLSLAVGIASLLFYLLSTQVALDTSAARTPIGIVVAASFVFLVFGRDHLYSPGRRIFRLQLVRLPGNVPGLFGRSMSVHQDSVPDKGFEPLVKAAMVIALGTALSIFCLAAALTTTQIFKTVQDYARTQQIIAGATPGETALSTWPRALLVGQKRGYVQVDARGPSGSATTVEFFLLRDNRRWRVSAARETAPSMSANFSLGTSDADIPPLPSDERAAQQ